MNKTNNNNKFLIISLIIVAVILSIFPLFAFKNAEFSGSDDAAGTIVEEINSEYEPWFTPIIENILGKELPGEIESLFFCVQTGIGVGVISYSFGYLVARKKYSKDFNV